MMTNFLYIFNNNINNYNNLDIYLKLGIGDWGLGIGDWGLGPIPNPQAHIPRPPSPNFYKRFYPTLVYNK